MLILAAHLYRLPRKYSFTLLLGSERVFSLDVNPARMHNNRAARVRVECTHWTKWPCEEVEPDDRDLVHKQWFHEFCARGGIAFTGSYESPPFAAGEQPGLI